METKIINPLRARYKITLKITLMWLSSVYGPCVPVCTPNNVWACSWWLCRWCPWGALSRPLYGHQWAPGQSVTILGTVECTDTKCPIGAQLDLGQGNKTDSQWHQWLRHAGTAYTLWPHQVGHCPAPGGAHCTSVRSANCSEDSIPVPNSSQGTVGYDKEVCATLQGFASPDHPWPTARPVMLDDVTGSTMSNTLSPDILRPDTCAQCEAALICEENRVPVINVPILVFSCKCQSTCMGWAVSTVLTTGCWVLMPPS